MTDYEDIMGENFYILLNYEDIMAKTYIFHVVLPYYSVLYACSFSIATFTADFQ